MSGATGTIAIGGPPHLPLGLALLRECLRTLQCARGPLQHEREQMQYPSMAAITGLEQLLTSSKPGMEPPLPIGGCTLTARTGAACPLARTCPPPSGSASILAAISFRSAPAENAPPPAPVRMTTNTFSSASAAPKASASPRISSLISAFIRSGRFIVM
jgi:hypothetical protein